MGVEIDIFQVVSALILSIVLALVFYTLNKASEAYLPYSKETRHMRVHALYRAVGIGCLVVSAATLCASFIMFQDMKWLLALTALFALLGLPCWVFYINHRVFLEDTKITVTSFLGKTRSLLWSDVKRASFSQLSHNLCIEGKDTLKLHIHEHIVGFATISEYLLEMTNVYDDQLE